MATLMVLLFLLSQAASELTVVEEQVGQDVTLPCQAVDGSITAVEWTKPDLKSPEYVLFYRDGHSDTAYQHTSFKGRVELVNNKSKDGDVSLILRKVSSSDEGTYECRVALGGSRHKRAVIDSQPIKTITLKVTGPQSGDTDKDMDKDVDMNGPHTHVGLIAGVLVCLAVAVVVMSFAVWKSKKQQKSEPPAADEASDVRLV